MISQSTMQSSSLVENPVIPQNRYLAVSSIKATRSDGHNRNSSLSKLKIDRQMTHRDYGDITKDYTNPDTLKNNPNITSKPIKQRHKRTDLNLLRLSKLKNDKKSSMKRYLELKDNSKISLMPKIPRITENLSDYNSRLDSLQKAISVIGDSKKMQSELYMNMHKKRNSISNYGK
mmetsp:Transcript_13344/g.13274  ORF Transcript_13344/g.13274 Transcript_13344/m.13274 type:complete len:175 (+) Transcript_13344:527-1051(+)